MTSFGRVKQPWAAASRVSEFVIYLNERNLGSYMVLWLENSKSIGTQIFADIRRRLFIRFIISSTEDSNSFQLVLYI